MKRLILIDILWSFYMVGVFIYNCIALDYMGKVPFGNATIFFAGNVRVVVGDIIFMTFLIYNIVLAFILFFKKLKVEVNRNR